jgi:hypothetical protein
VCDELLCGALLTEVPTRCDGALWGTAAGAREIGTPRYDSRDATACGAAMLRDG